MGVHGVIVGDAILLTNSATGVNLRRKTSTNCKIEKIGRVPRNFIGGAKKIFAQKMCVPPGI